MSEERDDETAQIEALAEDYFLGMYEGDVGHLTRISHSNFPLGFHTFLGRDHGAQG
ncbi:MAG: nuclear transport factor 2 family protein [Kiloniellales bacterium]|nr:nuclear transport factor 2 family protein [Kiloniellales bacterium]